MLNLTFKESGSSLDANISALIVELEKLGGQPFDRQTSDDRAVAGKRGAGGRAEPRLHSQRAHGGREALSASRIEQPIVDARLKRRRHPWDQPGGRRRKGPRRSQPASGGPRKIENDAEAMAAIKSLAEELVKACGAAGFEVTGSSESAGTGETLSSAF